MVFDNRYFLLQDVPEHLHQGALNNVSHHITKLLKEKVIGKFECVSEVGDS